jgi:CobQ-like glutamine amidotransferase family enzyme
MSNAPLLLGHLYPEEMNLYGDRGNILALRRRAARRGLNLEVVPIGLGAAAAELIPSCSGYFMGGGQDLDQDLVANDLITCKGDHLRRAVAAGAPLLAVCAGFQLLGTHYLTASGAEIPGLGLLPLHTEASGTRMVGNLVVTADPRLGLSDPTLVGFENHSGRTVLHGDLSALGQVVRGGGNDGRSGLEGAWRGTVIGTYLHGPLLPKNPSLCDWWLRAAAPRLDLPPLDDHLEHQARSEALALTAAPGRSSRWRLLGRGLIR